MKNCKNTLANNGTTPTTSTPHKTKKAAQATKNGVEEVKTSDKTSTKSIKNASTDNPNQVSNSHIKSGKVSLTSFL